KVVEDVPPSSVEDKVDANGTQEVPVEKSGDVEVVLEPVTKKAKVEGTSVVTPTDCLGDAPSPSEHAEHTEGKAVAVDENIAKEDLPSTNEKAPIDEPGFEVIDKESVPKPDSEEVRKAVSAQGEDGQLLVNFVQVSKDEVPPPDAPEVSVTNNDHANSNNETPAPEAHQKTIPEAKVLPSEKHQFGDSNGLDGIAQNDGKDKIHSDAPAEVANVDTVSVSREKVDEVKQQDVEATH
ncbi:unnamed protein product, partial [Schistocephalus solidus]|uniref:Microtubule-associated protein futsch n=1 Tax=Schistocephalus solidus TaxID=70667 RepID=A0A183TRU8_SCHSO